MKEKLSPENQIETNTVITKRQRANTLEEVGIFREVTDEDSKSQNSSAKDKQKQ